ncbi:MAG TPA: hypothetical protein PLZ95_04090 [Bryobacteraceae bacterium]|nr:hypothetical protein [Bryobacteraceae bacterium]
MENVIGSLKVDRRRLLGVLAAPVAAQAAEAPSAAALPAVSVGKFQVTRLVAGYNPIGGYSHAVPKLSALMTNWFTPERTLDYALSCERNGINTWQVSVDKKVFGALRTARERGSKLQHICLMRDETPELWKEIVDLKPIAVAHHGGVTDRLFYRGEQDKVNDFIKKAHDFGVMAGVSSHVPEHIARVEDSGWSHDLYMTCLYNVVREPAKLKAGLGDVPVDELFLANDPERMLNVVKQVRRPCLAFKVFAAGRLCNNQASMEKAMRFAYERLKPGDGLIVGMFPIISDEIATNAGMVRRILAAS